MAESIVSDLTVRVLEHLGKSVAERIAPYFGGKGRLNELQLTMEMIQARLYDAEKRQEAEEGALIKVWLKGLRRVMYRLEDFLEDVTISEKQDEQRAPGKLAKAVRFLPSMLSTLKMDKRLYYEAQDIMRELDRITSNMDRFHFKVCDNDLERRGLNKMSRREETHSFIVEEEVIGRDDDKNAILQMLFECHDVEKNLSVIPIVGMGGLGKTTLAQLVYNDKQVQQNFELKCWACISDQISSFKELAGEVLHSITREEWQSLSADDLQSHLRQAVNEKKFLLVLDDVWDDNRERWLHLERLLRGGKEGSKIIVTSRSEVVASNMGTVKPYVLNNLSEEKSWALFKSIAFKYRQEETNQNLISIGKEIVKKCGNVPLAIRTIAGLLYSRDTEEEWVHFKDKEIGMIEQRETDIMPTLKISYRHLLPQQKQCFAYCALFPKDYEFNIERLICLWMAQGFVKSLVDGRICFLELLRRCFFQNVSRNWHDEETCQMHDLMHDLAQMVGDESLLIHRPQENVNGNVRHVGFINASPVRVWVPPSRHTRSYITTAVSSRSDLNEIFSSLRQLRVLDLGVMPYRLPDSIRKLKHLRYLGVSVRGHLPRGITKLRYLETLKLYHSLHLRELPREFYKLSSLKYLHIRDMWFGSELIDMPLRFGELISLQYLDTFIVGKNNGLDALGGMNLAGRLWILLKKHRPNALSEAMEANLKGKKLTALSLSFELDDEEYFADELLERLQPPPTVEKLTVGNWKGVRFPNWGIDELPNLVDLSIWNCMRCQHLPASSRLPHIKKLWIIRCEELDLWDAANEDGVVHDAGKGNGVNSSAWACLKCLEYLCLEDMSKLQSLPRGIGGITTLQDLHIVRLENLKTLPESIGVLTKLRELNIDSCPKLEALPKSIQKLTALQELRINYCPLLTIRCQEPDGDDWPLIQHIPRKDISLSPNFN